MTRLATLEVTLKAGGEELTMPRYEFNHALECMGERPTPWGVIPADYFRDRLTKARKHMQFAPKEFTASEQTIKVGKDVVTFAALTAEKVSAILTKLWVFAERVGNSQINF